MCCFSQVGTLFVFWLRGGLGLEPTANSRYFMLNTASLSALGYENDLSRPVIRFWNDTHHVDTADGSAAHPFA
jgi:probable phosphoglycerate mutase